MTSASIALIAVAKYEIDISERQRADRKQRGLANMQYIRFDRWFLLLITDGNHRFRREEKSQNCTCMPCQCMNDPT